jgi:hypothetical protein
MSSEIEIETIPGLPGDLPPGERVLWQGRPEWKALARNTFKVRMIAAYFAVFIAARLFVAVQDREGVSGLLHTLLAASAAATCLGVLSLMAYVNARATIYTITTRRIVLRIGVALPMSWNLPFKRLAAADLNVRKEGDGDIALKLSAPNRIAWLHLWPHVAPWQYSHARPTLRAIAEPARVSKLLAEAFQNWAAEEATPVKVANPETFVVPSTPERITPGELAAE